MDSPDLALGLCQGLAQAVCRDFEEEFEDAAGAGKDSPAFWRTIEGTAAVLMVLARREAAKASAAEAKAAVSGFKRQAGVQPRDSGLSLVWPLVLRHMSHSKDLQQRRQRCHLSNLHNTSCGLLALAQTCREMHSLVSAEALPALAASLPAWAWEHEEVMGLEQQRWANCRPLFAKLCQDPGGFTLQELKAGARGLPSTFRVRICGTKAELTLRLLACVGLSGPTRAPSDLLMAIAWEKKALCTERLPS